jgi:hypothetical protein
MYKYSVSVRAYYIGLLRGYNLTTSAGCIAAAEDLLIHPASSAGKRVITELYRAGGLGVYQIYKRLGETKSPEEIRALCERYDMMLHDGLE